MIKIKPVHSRKKVKKAGDILRNVTASAQDRDDAMDVLSNWRAIHSYPINTFQATLREKLYHIDREGLVAQRLKRTPSIISKLQRFPQMNLARMQDIGGLRAVVKNIKKCRQLETNYRNSKFSHELVDEKDYIKKPKPTGYRGIHLIYKYKNHRAPEYDGLNIELQIRTKLQHAWATAVETAGTFTNHALKSSEGPAEWLQFFALASSAFAIIEKENKVAEHENLSDKEIYELVINRAEKLDVVNTLKFFSITANHIKNDNKSGSYHIVVLDTQNKTVAIESYGKRNLAEANKRYTNYEKELENGDGDRQVVLVATSSIEQLKKAYPNYFLDTVQFIAKIRHIERIVKGSKN